MQQRAGLLFLSKSTGRILLIYEDSKWTIPTFTRNHSVLEDACSVMNKFSIGKILPIELYISEDKGFEYGTYVCLTDSEFLTTEVKTIAWSDLEDLPKNLHAGLKQTLQNNLIRLKLKTIIELANSLQ
jgi:hypothetical protein